MSPYLDFVRIGFRLRLCARSLIAYLRHICHARITYFRVIYFRTCSGLRVQTWDCCNFIPKPNMRSSRVSGYSDYTILSILVSICVLHAHCRVLTPSLSLTVPTNLTKHWAYRHCVSDPTWNPQTRHIASSCESALVALVDDSSTWGRHTGVFRYQPGGRSTADFPGAPSILTLPRRYVSGDCVVAIVMMKMFERSSIGQFPGLPDSVIGKWRARDTSTWKEMIEPAEYVRATCDNGCGYAVLGKDFGIGIAIWAFGSSWDRYARDIASLSEDGEVDTVLRLGNSSVAGVVSGSVLETL